ncbi:MAG TPA: sodium:proton antiporter [Stellaceae bacterium]|nr:sodium:proton antiporter [Stellaceae bacterium]
MGVALGTVVAVSPAPVSAADMHGAAVAGTDLSLVLVSPFIGMLLSIALFPLVAPHFWHRWYGMVSGFWALAFLVPFTAQFGVDTAIYEVLHALIGEYVPFILLLLALYTISGGVRVTGTLIGRPVVNTIILAVGTAIASVTGTTGAAMLLIRPLLLANAWRRKRVHTIVFFIFLVGNIGGALSPLGDPPLFLGFLNGVDFFWPTRHLLLPMLVLTVILLALHHVIDGWHYRHERVHPTARPGPHDQPFGIEGKINLLLLLGVILAVLLSGVWRPGIVFDIRGVPLPLESLARDIVLLALTGLSLWLTDGKSRRLNGFIWFPIVEVAKLFAAIFITIIPAIAILRAGGTGALGAMTALVNQGGQPINGAYFWATGLLSSVLDNAPTYLVFFNLAGGDPALLMTQHATTLLAISAGAVFMGALTYIGNAPNFMVKSIAERAGVPMPSFFGFMLWSWPILLPLFGLLTVMLF